MTPAQARDELARLCAASPSPFPYDRAALLLAVDEHPELEPELYEAQLDRFAAGVRRRLDGGDDGGPRRRLGALRQVLFEEGGLHGNRDAYYDVRNSYLNEVLDRRLGIPISLATVMLGVARRLGWPLEPVSFPGHVLVRYSAGDEILAVDPFHGGLILSPDELVERWRLGTGTEAPTLGTMLRPAEPRAWLVRMLNNIWLVHRQRGELSRAAVAVEKIALIEPEQPLHLRLAGQLWLQCGNGVRAARYLGAYLEAAPAAPDAEGVREALRRLEG